MKKFLCALLATAMLATMTVTSFADDTPTVQDQPDYQIVINDDNVTEEMAKDIISQLSNGTSPYTMEDVYGYDKFYLQEPHTCSPTAPYAYGKPGGWIEVSDEATGRFLYKFRLHFCIERPSCEAVGVGVKYSR